MIIHTSFRFRTIMWGLPLAAILVFSLNAFAFTRSQNSTGTICYYWANRNLSFVVNDKCSKDVNLTDCYGAVRDSIMAWMGHPCSDLTLSFVGSTPQTDTGLDCTNLIIWRESNNPKDPNYWRYEPNVIALTTTTFNTSTGEISDADIEVNGVDFKFSTSTPVASGYTDIQNTLTHEMGHCIGLDHSCNDVTNVMCPTATTGETMKRTLKQDDINGLCYVYPAGQKTPLCSAQHELTVAASCSHGGGCTIATNSNSEIQGLALVALLLFFLRTYFRRVNRDKD